MTNKLLTIVTVTKNCSRTIERTLLSVQSVKNSNIQFIVIDGVSTDDTMSIIIRHSHIADIIISEPDAGIYNAMNKGVAKAQGKYICFINGDDELVPDKFNFLLAEMEQHSEPIICGNTMRIDFGSVAERIRPVPWRLLFYNSIPHPSSFVPTKFLKSNPFREDLVIASDYDFFLRSFLKGIKFKLIDLDLANHYSGGISSSVMLSFEEVRKVRKDRLLIFIRFLDMIAYIYKKTKVSYRIITKHSLG